VAETSIYEHTPKAGEWDDEHSVECREDMLQNIFYLFLTRAKSTTLLLLTFFLLAQEFVARRGLPFHKKLNNFYRLNIGFQSHNRKLKAELQHCKDGFVQRNLNLLVEVAIEREEPVVNKNTLAVKKPVTKKKT
jgi:hypothetical protein